MKRDELKMCKNSKFRMRTFAYACSLIATSLILFAFVSLPSPSLQDTYAQLRPRFFESTIFRSINGKTYLVLRWAFPFPGEDRVRVTTLFGTTGTGLACGGGIGNSCGDTVTAASGVVGVSSLFNDGSGVLNSCFKSEIIPTTAIPTFDPCADGGNGELTFPGSVTVTIGGMIPVGVATPDVPAAAQTGPFIGEPTCFFNDTFMFGGFFPTTQSVICNPAPFDGFDLPLGKSIVFAWNTGLVGFVLGVAGFAIDDNGDSVVCNSANPPGCQNGVIGSLRLADSLPPPTTPTTTCPTTTTTTTSTTTTTLICQCPDDIPLGCISGTVIYAPNGQPHPGMTVTLRRISPRPRTKMEVTADSNGCYLFADLGDGKYRLRLKGCESRSSKRERTVIITDGGKVNNKDIGWWHNRRLTRCFFTVRN